MPDVTKRFRWGSSVEAILHHFSTPEIRVLEKHCRKRIRDFTNPELEGEGYRCTVIPFEMFEYGFSLVYDFDEEIWKLEVITQPDFDAPDCNRRRPQPNGRGGTGGSRRAVGYERRVVLMLRELAFLAHYVREYLEDTRTSFVRVEEARRKRISAEISTSHVTACIQMLNAFAEQGSHGCTNVVLLVRSKVSAVLSYLGPLFVFADGTPTETLWDPSLFGRRLEPASG